MHCQEREEEEGGDPPIVPGLGTRTDSTLLFSTTTRFYDMKQKRNCSFFTYRSIAKTKLNDPIIGSLVTDRSRIFNYIHSRGQDLYGSF